MEEVAMEEVFPIASLPDEVMAIVFSHLGVKDRLQACLVCRKWLELINCRSLLCDIKVNIKSFDFEDDYPGMTRNFQNFVCLGSTEKEWKSGIKCMSPRTKYLCLDTDKLDKDFECSIDMTFEKLTKLDIFSVSTWQVFPSCPNLLSLSLQSNTITDVFIDILQNNMKRLRILRLLFITIVDDPNELRKYYQPGVIYKEYTSSEILSIFAVKKFIAERASTLSEIEISVDVLTEITLKVLCIKGLNLKILRLSTEESSLSDISKYLIAAFRHLKDLKTISLYGFNLNDDVGNAICVCLPYIKELEISCKITDKCLKDLFQLMKLNKLYILESTGFTPSGFREAIASFKSFHIKQIALQNFVFPKDSESFFKKLTNLVELDLTHCHIIDSHVHIISTYLVKLEKLVLRGNDDISDYGLTTVKDLKENQDNTLSDKTSGHKALCNLKLLTILDLSSCTKLTDNGIITSVRFLCLHTLMLSGLILAENTYSVLHSQNPLIRHIQRDSSGLDPF